MKYRLGIDAGSSYVKLVLIDSDSTIVNRCNIPTQPDVESVCRKCMDNMLRENSLTEDDLVGIAATGYGRRQIGFADKVITEITALAMGAFGSDKQVRTILDVGGQDSKAISLDEEGNVTDFALNSKCAAGTGRFLEVTSASLGIALEDLALLAEKADRSLSLSSTCTVFAESEIISHLAAGEKKENIIRALHAAVTNQLVGLLHQVGCITGSPLLFTGGVAQNKAIADRLSENLKSPVNVPPYPQYLGALGAALSLNPGSENENAC